MCSISTNSPCVKIALYSGLLLLIAHLSAAQVKQLNRFEIPIGDSEPGFKITSVEKKGLYLHRHLTTPEMDVIDVRCLDTAFQELWHGFLPVEKHLLPVGQKAFKSDLYFLLRPVNGNQFQLYVLQHDGKYSHFTFESFIRFNTTEFSVTDRSLLIGGYFNRVPVVLHYDLGTKLSKILPGMFNEEGELTQVRTNEDGSFQVLINARNMYKQKTIWLKSYTADGMLIHNIALRPEENKSLLFGRSIKTQDNMQIISGVYGTRNGDFSRGVFVATIDPSGLQQVRYYNYADLHNFFRYMKIRRESRVKERIERRKIRGKKVRFNYRVLVHDLVEDNGNFILLGEAFYPQYSSSNRGMGYSSFFRPYNPYNTSYIRGDQVFDGYRYTHAVVIGFDPNGKLLWDNSFEIEDVKTYTLEQYVRLSSRNNRTTLLYLYDNRLRSKVIMGDQVLEGVMNDPLETMFKTDIVMGNSFRTQLDYWYEDNFYAFGIQDIINPQQNENPKRRVFFINKIGP